MLHNLVLLSAKVGNKGTTKVNETRYISAGTNSILRRKIALSSNYVHCLYK